MPEQKVRFLLPPKGTFTQGGPDDPLPYYYHPIAGVLYRERINCCLSLLTPPYHKLLDIGYGSGILLPTLFSICSELVAVDRDSDPVPVSLVLEEMGIHVRLIQDDITTADFCDHSFDLITAFSVLEEVRDLPGVLNVIAQLLRPGGTLLVGMPRVDKLMEILFRCIGYTGIEEEHVHSYKTFLDFALRNLNFHLGGFSKMPRKVPRFAALYYAMLLVKP